MANPSHDSPIGDDLLEAVTDAMVALHARYHGHRPASARTRVLDDMLACVLGDMYTDVEKTIIEMQRKALVHEVRSAFQQAMERRFITIVEELTSRKVAKFIPTHHVGPDLELELSVFES